jgi:hypothetical protein
MLYVIVATGNHFFVDALIGGVVVVAAWLLARAVAVEAPSRRPLSVDAVGRAVRA